MAGRKRRRREDEDHSYWLSYSDMMAGLLLMFVIIISFTMMQAKRQYEEDARALAAQQLTLNTQKQQLTEQQKTVDEQEKQLASQQTTLEKQQEQLALQQTTVAEQESQLASQQKTLEEQQKTLEEQQKELDAQKSTVASQEKELAAQQKTVDEQEKQLASQQKTVDEQEKKLAEQQKQLEAQQTTVASQEKQLEEQKSQIENQQKQMQELVGIRSDLIAALREAFSGTAGVSVDAQTGAIKFDSSVLFDYDASELSEDGEAFLREFLPQYFSVLLSDEFKEYVSEIMIEGHTDTSGDYLYNLDLSQRRALAVATFCLAEEEEVLSGRELEQLRAIVTANGRSYSNPIYGPDGEVDMDASRRVEFKFRLREEEMVDQMMQILSGE